MGSLGLRLARPPFLLPVKQLLKATSSPGHGIVTLEPSSYARLGTFEMPRKTRSQPQTSRKTVTVTATRTTCRRHRPRHCRGSCRAGQ